MAPNSNILPSSRHHHHLQQQQRKRKYHDDEGDFSDDDSGFSPKSSSPSADDDRRAHHNELERRRRDHIKDHFSSLKNAIPLLEGEKSSRALILKRAVDYIQVLQAQLKEAKMEIEDFKQRRSNENNNCFRQNVGVFNGILPQIPQVSQQPQQHLQQQSQSILHHPLPSVSSAFMSLPSTSVIQHQSITAPAAPIVFPTVSECLQPLSSSSPLTVSPPSYISSLPLPTQQQPTAVASESTKNALLSQLLQLINQTPTAPSLLPPPASTTALPHISLPQTDFNNNQQLFAFHERQLSSAVHL